MWLSRGKMSSTRSTPVQGPADTDDGDVPCPEDTTLVSVPEVLQMTSPTPLSRDL